MRSMRMWGMAVASFALAVCAWSDARVTIYDGSTDRAKIASWGNTKTKEADKVRFLGKPALEVETRGLYEGGRIDLVRPFDLAPFLKDPDASYLVLVLQVPEAIEAKAALRGIPGMEGMPGMPGMPGYPGMPGQPGMPPEGMPGMPGQPGMPGMPGYPGMPGGAPPAGMPGMPPEGMPGMPGQPGMPGMPGYPGMPGGPPPAGMPGMPPEGMPGMPGYPGMPGGPPAPGMPGMPPEGMPGMPPGGMLGMPGGAAQPPAPKEIERIRAVIATDKGLIDCGAAKVDKTAVDAEGWLRVVMPVSAFKGIGKAEDAKVQKVAVFGDAPGIFYVGRIWIVQEDTPLLADPGPRQRRVRVGQEVRFEAADQPKGARARYTWDFDDLDGITEDAVGPRATWKFEQEGYYTVTLTVKDMSGSLVPKVAHVYVLAEK